MQKYLRYIVLAFAVIFVISAIYFLEKQKPERTKLDNFDLSSLASELNLKSDTNYPKAKEISMPDGYINTDSITIAEHLGKDIILLDFWTYSCINCQRTLPYLTQWYDKYHDKGLVIIGVHTPEFAFEKEYDNVKRATEKFGVKYPVVLDNNYFTWAAYGNRYWPRKYIIDLNGDIVYDHIGEGAYRETEEVIQKLLADRAEKLDKKVEVEMEITEPEGAEFTSLFKRRSPEIYFGALRNQWLANGDIIKGKAINFSEPKSIEKNNLYLVGDWIFTDEYAQAASKGAKVIFKYEAEKVFWVASSEEKTRIRVLNDGMPVATEDFGEHVTDGYLNVQEDGLYRVIENDSGHGVHTLELIIEDPGVKAFAFTFG